MYTKQWMRNFDGFTQDNPMDLQKFTEFYDQHIAERFFTYTTTSNLLPSFIIEVRRNQLPHLLGLQKWNNVDVRQPEKQYSKLISGEWDIDFLKKADSGAYKEYRARIEFAPHLYNLLYHYECRVRLLNSKTPSPFTRRKIDMIFQKGQGKYVFLLELRENDNKFIPTSITSYRQNANVLRVKSLPLDITDVSIEEDR